MNRTLGDQFWRKELLHVQVAWRPSLEDFDQVYLMQENLSTWELKATGLQSSYKGPEIN